MPNEDAVPPGRPLRRDALANRERILAEAVTLVAEHGTDVSFHALARRAGVGVGTVYRHFPAGDDLVRALYDRLYRQLAAVEGDVLDASTGWDGVVRFVDGVVSTFADRPDALAVMERMRSIDVAYRPAQASAAAMIAMTARAQQEGSLRGDVNAVDLALVPYALASFLRFPEPERTVMLARQRRLMLDGLRAEGAQPMPGTTQTADHLDTALHNRRPGG